jgi:hypothetical protein
MKRQFLQSRLQSQLNHLFDKETYGQRKPPISTRYSGDAEELDHLSQATDALNLQARNRKRLTTSFAHYSILRQFCSAEVNSADSLM